MANEPCAGFATPKNASISDAVSQGIGITCKKTHNKHQNYWLQISLVFLCYPCDTSEFNLAGGNE
jgi:hypothetical protein